jgi:hypothetical protein
MVRRRFIDWRQARDGSTLPTVFQENPVVTTETIILEGDE